MNAKDYVRPAKGHGDGNPGIEIRRNFITSHDEKAAKDAMSKFLAGVASKVRELDEKKEGETK